MKRLRLIILFLFLSLLTVYGKAENYTAQKADITVAADGSGDVKTVQEAIDRVPENNKKRLIIAIKSGVYKEQIKVPADKPFISFIGENAATTRLTFDLTNKAAGSTSASYSVYIGGHDFYAENITFENSFGIGSQAVALLSDADRLIFKNCRFLGWQDTLYAKGGRQYFKDCYIEGAVDYIFGEAAAVFENCEIHSKTDGYITAPMRFSADEPTGYVFIKSKLTSENTQKGIFLGRPWRDYGRTVYLETEMNAVIRPEGWNNWLPEREKTAYFAEYKSSGKGASDSTRVKWAHQLTADEAAQFSVENFLGGKDIWNPKAADSAAKAEKSTDFKPISWGSGILTQKPLWYATDDAARVADQLLLYQKDNGGWEKNIDDAAMLTQKEKDELAKTKNVGETTIDNRTSYTQVEYLAKVITASLAKPQPPNNFPQYKEAFNKGLDYLFAAQYDNGGYPQFYPLKKGYYTHITYNDDAMVGVLRVLKDIAEKKPDYAFVDENKRLKAENAVNKGIEVILKTQVVVNGNKTVWCAQHDEKTFAPAPARKFEPISLSGYESVGVVRFLMSINKPNQEIIEAIESAIKWFEKSKIEGIKVIEKPDNSPRGFDRIVVSDKSASPLWARFYEIETNKPIFIGRDAINRYSLAEIEQERRTGYNYYTNAPEKLLDQDYPKWVKKIKN